jgi:hypothetical protein
MTILMKHLILFDLPPLSLAFGGRWFSGIFKLRGFSFLEGKEVKERGDETSGLGEIIF